MPLGRGNVDSKSELRLGLDVRQFAETVLRGGESVRLVVVSEQVELGVFADPAAGEIGCGGVWQTGSTVAGNSAVALTLGLSFGGSETGSTTGSAAGSGQAMWSGWPETLEVLPAERWWLLGQTPDGIWQIALYLDEVAKQGLLDAHAQLQFQPVTAVGAWFSDEDALLGTQAAALARWHGATKFCTRCGKPVAVTEAGWSVTCTGCQAIEYPRSDPAVIVAITDGQDRLLLMHDKTWPAGRVSVLAGFVEAGESPERTVVREAKEEAGLQVDSVKYVGSQPWPQPRSLMLCFTAKAVGQGGATPQPDGQEIDDARFYSREELTALVRAGKLTLPGETAVARVLISSWFGQPLPDVQQAAATDTSRV